jgi:hypothetical protein
MRFDTRTYCIRNDDEITNSAHPINSEQRDKEESRERDSGRHVQEIIKENSQSAELLIKCNEISFRFNLKSTETHNQCYDHDNVLKKYLEPGFISQKTKPAPVENVPHHTPGMK